MHDAVAPKLRGARIVSDQDSRRLTSQIVREVVWALEDRWPELVSVEFARAWSWATSRGRWDQRRWGAARRIANLLPGVIVAQSVSRMMVETQRDDDGPTFGVPVGTYVDRWADRYPGMR